MRLIEEYYQTYPLITTIKFEKQQLFYYIFEIIILFNYAHEMAIASK